MHLAHSRHYLLIALSLVLLPGFGFSAQAEEVTTPTLIDRTHRSITEHLSAPARWFDNFFQDPRLDEEPAGTFLRLRGSIILEEGEKPSYLGKVKARLRLPNLKRRYHLLLSSQEDELKDANLQDARTDRELTQTETTNLALQYTQRRSADFDLSHRLQVDLEEQINPQLRSRARISLPLGAESLFTLTQTAFWENEAGFGEESRLDYDLPLSNSMLLRTSGQGLFSESSNGYEWLAMSQWLTAFSHKKALDVGIYLTGETRPQNQVGLYATFIKYRQRIIKKWLYVELRPEVQWLRERKFAPTGLFSLTFEVQFAD